MPFLYNPNDTEFDVGEFASTWSFPEPNTSANANTSRGTGGTGRPSRIFEPNPHINHIPESGPVGLSPLQDPSQSAAMRVQTRTIIDATGPTLREPIQVVPLTMGQPILVSTFAERSRISRNNIEALLASSDIASIADLLEQATSAIREQRRALRRVQLAQGQADPSQPRVDSHHGDSGSAIDQVARADDVGDAERSTEWE